MTSERIALRVFTVAAAILCSQIGGAAAGAPVPANMAVSDTRPLSYQVPWLASDPANRLHVAVAYQEEGHQKGCYLGVSTDGGASWRNGVLVGDGGRFPVPQGNHGCRSPRVDFTPTGGLVYAFDAYPTVYSNYVMVAPAIDGAFSAPVNIDPATEQAAAGTQYYFVGYPGLAIDPTTGSGPARIYVSEYMLDYRRPGFYSVGVALSEDGGRTFHPTVVVASGANSINPSTLMAAVVDPAGTFSLAYLTYNFYVYREYTPAPAQILFVSSRDHGQTFSAPRQLLSFPSGCSLRGLYPQVGGDAYACPRHWPSLDMSAGPRPGHLYLTWATPTAIPACITVGTCDVDSPPVRMWFADTSDGGSTWSAARSVGVPHDERNSLILPSVRSSPRGRIDVAYYELDGGGFEDTYLTSSADGGATFGRATRISSVSSNTAVAPTQGYECAILGNMFGNRECEYLGLASADAGALVAWTDSRRGTVDNAKEDIYFGSTVPSATTASGSSEAVGGNPNTMRGGPGRPDLWVIAALAATIGLRRGRRRG